MFAEADFLPLSGLQHMAFCERRWALVQIENIWEENRFTAEGRVLHERAHSGEIESRPGVLIRRTMPIHSFRLGLSGQADVVEFQPVREESAGVRLEGRRGLWRVVPIEYKRRRDKGGSMAYRVQLCAQALCLEEMLGAEIGEGAVYDATTRRRQVVACSPELRSVVESLAMRMHALFERGETPKPILKAGCQKCSLHERCQPEVLSRARLVGSYIARSLKDSPSR